MATVGDMREPQATPLPASSPPPAVSPPLTNATNRDSTTPLPMPPKAGTPAETNTKKRKAAAKKASSPDGEVEGSKAKKAKKAPKATAPKPGSTPAKPRKKTVKNKTSVAIPRAYAECTQNDKKLIDWAEQDHEGKPKWAEIRQWWLELTGEPTGGSTLANRYARLKMNFTSMYQKDQALLIECKKQVDEGFEKQQWELVSQAMKEKGWTDHRTPEVLKLQYRGLMTKAGKLQAGEDPDDGEGGDEGGEANGQGEVVPTATMDGRKEVNGHGGVAPVANMGGGDASSSGEEIKVASPADETE